MKLAIGPCMAVLLIVLLIAAMVSKSLNPSPLKIDKDEK